MADSPVQIELALCKACGICIELCPDKVFDRDQLAYPEIARPEDCSQCLLCELHCPDFAIEGAAAPAIRPGRRRCARALPRRPRRRDQHHALARRGLRSRSEG